MREATRTSPDQGELLDVRDLWVRYGNVAAVQGISLTVGRGEIVAVVGPNGAGKSSALSAIMGLAPVARGTVTLDGEQLAGRRAEQIVRRGIALVPEGRRIFGELSVEENLLLGGSARRDRKSIDADVEAQMERFPVLGRLRRQRADRLSGGEQQQLAIARALVSRPRLLMLDEPSLGLAPMVVRQVFDTVEELRGAGTTVLLVEQNALAAVALADRAYVLRTGRVFASGTRDDFARQSSELKLAYLGEHA